MVANWLTVIRQNVATILAMDDLLALVPVENVQVYDRDVDLRGHGQTPGLAEHRARLVISRREFARATSSAFRFGLRFLVMVRCGALKVETLEAIELQVLRGCMFLAMGQEAGTGEGLADTSPAIVDDYVVSDVDPEIDSVGEDYEGWESVFAVTAVGTCDYASMIEVEVPGGELGGGGGGSLEP